MKDLNNYIIESSITPREIRRYAKSVITNSYEYSQYVLYVQNILEGIREGIVENERYYKGKQASDTEDFSLIVDSLIEVFNKEIK